MSSQNIRFDLGLCFRVKFLFGVHVALVLEWNLVVMRYSFVNYLLVLLGLWGIGILRWELGICGPRHHCPWLNFESQLKVVKFQLVQSQYIVNIQSCYSSSSSQALRCCASRLKMPPVQTLPSLYRMSSLPFLRPRAKIHPTCQPTMQTAREFHVSKIQNDLVAPPDPISHMRPIIYDTPSSQSQPAYLRHPYSLTEFTAGSGAGDYELQFRLLRQQLDSLHQNFWLDVSGYRALFHHIELTGP